MQQWHFVAVNNPKIKHEIRVAAEAEEKEFYAHRAPKAWLEALASLGIDSKVCAHDERIRERQRRFH